MKDTSPPPPKLRGVFRADERARASYAEGAGIYRIIPTAVAVPLDSADLQSLIRWARSSEVPLIPRGAGSALGGGNVGEGVVVDLTRLPKVLEVDAERRLARVSANVSCGELNRAASRHRLRLPPDPSSAAWATLGGMVSTNASGARTVKYGSIRRWVSGLDVVTSDAELQRLSRDHPMEAVSEALGRFQTSVAPTLRAAAPLIGQRFPETRKNSSGYALDVWLRSDNPLDLLIGGEGTLAMITGIDLRLDAIPRERGSAKIALGRLESLGEIVPALLHHGPSAVELLDRTFLDLVRGAGRKGLPGVPAESEAILIVDFEGDDEDMVRGAVSDVAETARPWALDVETALSPEDDQRLWALRHAASPIMAGLSETRRAMQVVEDGCVPVARLSEYIRFLRHAAETHRLEAVIFGHAGDGNIHVNLLPEVVRRGWQDEVAGMMAEVTAQIIALGGTTTGEHGDGRLRAGSLEKQYGVEIVSLFRSVKAAFDPAGILNPGVILPTGKSSPIDRLKMGADAVDLPVDIARSLREIERTGGYARDRMELAG